MVLFNYSTKEITAKVVYYGPGLCGKTTNLQYIYDNLPQNIQRGRMLSLATKTDRTLFFDFLPIDLGNIRGMKTRVQLYTVPGQVFYNSTRKLVLKGADGIVFVADSQVKMKEANLESFRNLEENCVENGINITETPLVLQFNKRDLPGIASVEDLSNTLNKYNAPFYESVATTGIGVHETLKGITKLVLHSLREKYSGDAAAARSAPPPRAPAVAVVKPVPPPLPPPADDPIVLLEEEAAPLRPRPVEAAPEPILLEAEDEPLLLEDEPAPGGEGLDDVFADADEEEDVLLMEETAAASAPAAPALPVVPGLLSLSREPVVAPGESFADLAVELGSDPRPVAGATPDPLGIEEEDPLGLDRPLAARLEAPSAASLPPILIEAGTDEVEIPLNVRVGDEVQRHLLRLRIRLTREE